MLDFLKILQNLFRKEFKIKTEIGKIINIKIMAIRIYKSLTPGTRFCATNKLVWNQNSTNTAQTKKNSNIKGFQRSNGRNNQGRITVRHRGGGHKRRYRFVLWKRFSQKTPGKVIGLEYDPNRNAFLAKIETKNQSHYILATQGLKLGQIIESCPEAPLISGNALPLLGIPVGSEIHNIELAPMQGAKLVRAAGTSAQVIAKEGKYASIRLPSGEVRLILQMCWATLGRVGNEEYANIRDGKAGRKRWRGRRPHVRGSVMNPCDHPHGGGEGRAPIGRSQPVDPWGKPALGRPTRSKYRYSNKLIVRRA